MHPGQVNIFIRYSEKIIKQYKIYILNLRYIIKNSIINFIKDIIKKIINLKFQSAYL